MFQEQKDKEKAQKDNSLLQQNHHSTHVMTPLKWLDSFDCRKLAMYMLSNGKKFLLLFCELFLQFHNNLQLGCNAGDFYKYSMTFYMKDKPKCVILKAAKVPSCVVHKRSIQ